ncbi:MAG: hypothetical protein ACTHKP_01285 [Nitrososphaeraceae archaeon]|jgi:hypothetical protein
MKAIANALFAVVLAVMMIAASALFIAGYTSVLTKKSKDLDSNGGGNGDSSSSSSNLDNGNKGPFRSI